MSKHTPGPWTLSEFTNATNGEPWFRVHGAHTLLLEIRPDPDGYMTGVNAANARLIAAAPDLLATLEMVQRFQICICKQLSIIAEKDSDDPVCDYCKTEAVIAKAKGES
jgi:hypothetical protein